VEAMSSTALQNLEQWLKARLSGDDWQWLQSSIAVLRNPHEPRDLHICLGLVPRKLGRADLNLSDAEITSISRDSNLVQDFSNWTVETAARVLMLGAVADYDEASFGDIFSDLCKTADLAESITFYRGLAFYPNSTALELQVGQGLRSNISAVFEAIAHRNPYPYLNFDENRWNHMVLKALFIDSALAPIQGLDERANSDLAFTLCNYAHERWAANRPVSPELWRCVGPFANGDMIDDLRRVVNSTVDEERKAGLLALSQCPDNAAHQVLSRYPDDARAIDRGVSTWTTLSAYSVLVT